MIRTLLTFALLSVGLASCQSVPAERKSNCACLWERPEGFAPLMEGVQA